MRLFIRIVLWPLVAWNLLRDNLWEGTTRLQTSQHSSSTVARVTSRLHPNTRNQALGTLEATCEAAVRFSLWFASTRSTFQLGQASMHLPSHGYCRFVGSVHLGSKHRRGLDRFSGSLLNKGNERRPRWRRSRSQRRESSWIICAVGQSPDEAKDERKQRFHMTWKRSWWSGG